MRQTSIKSVQDWNDWDGKVIQYELCKRLKFDHTTKWYIQKPESIQEKGAHKILRDFYLPAVHLISVRRPDLVLRKKKRKEREFAILRIWPFWRTTK